MEINQTKGVEPKMKRECWLRSGAKWQGALKQKGLKRVTYAVYDTVQQ